MPIDEDVTPHTHGTNVPCRGGALATLSDGVEQGKSLFGVARTLLVRRAGCQA
jgi:hypothetical protein